MKQDIQEINNQINRDQNNNDRRKTSQFAMNADSRDGSLQPRRH
jgi:hypothetical protein